VHHPVVHLNRNPDLALIGLEELERVVTLIDRHAVVLRAVRRHSHLRDPAVLLESFLQKLRPIERRRSGLLAVAEYRVTDLVERAKLAQEFFSACLASNSDLVWVVVRERRDRWAVRVTLDRGRHSRRV